MQASKCHMFNISLLKYILLDQPAPYALLLDLWHTFSGTFVYSSPLVHSAKSFRQRVPLSQPLVPFLIHELELPRRQRTVLLHNTACLLLTIGSISFPPVIKESTSFFYYYLRLSIEVILIGVRTFCKNL